MKCPRCHTEVPDDANFCQNCHFNLKQYKQQLSKQTLKTNTRPAVPQATKSVKTTTSSNVQPTNQSNDHSIKPTKSVNLLATLISKLLNRPDLGPYIAIVLTVIAVELAILLISMYYVYNNVTHIQF